MRARVSKTSGISKNIKLVERRNNCLVETGDVLTVRLNEFSVEALGRAVAEALVEDCACFILNAQNNKNKTTD